MDSGAYLHGVSQNELTSGEKDTITRSREPTVITTANKGRVRGISHSVRQRFGVFFFHDDAVGRFTGSAISGLYCAKMERLEGAKSENHVPVVTRQFLKNIVYPMTLRWPSGDRMQIPGAQASGDGSRKVLQSGVPCQENPGQASGDRLHIPCVQAQGGRSRRGPEWLQLF